MAKKSMLERESKRKKLVSRYSKRREEILKELKKVDSLEQIFALNEKLQKFVLMNLLFLILLKFLHVFWNID